MAQFPVHLLSVQLQAQGIRMESANSIHSSGCSIFLRPQRDQSAAIIKMSNTAILEYGLEQAIQDPLCAVEYFRSLRCHALCMVQVGYSEIEGEGH